MVIFHSYVKLPEGTITRLMEINFMIMGQQKPREWACNWIKIGCKYYNIIIEDMPGTGPAIGASIRRTKGCKRMSGYFLNSGY